MASGAEPGNRFPCAAPDCHAPRFTCQAVAYWRRLVLQSRSFPHTPTLPHMQFSAALHLCAAAPDSVGDLL